jgi:hypothetical protein
MCLVAPLVSQCFLFDAMYDDTCAGDVQEEQTKHRCIAPRAPMETTRNHYEFNVDPALMSLR